ncbi:hypothetical+protein [Methylocapsa aurea]|uniref:hypothetical protein n=1 Tax=Methylocapsa aurea TaxID=663610 RepID=UPI003D18B687
MNAPFPDPLTIAAAKDYRANLPKRRGRETAPLRCEFSREMQRSHICDVLGPVPADALAAHVALQFGDDDEAYFRLSRIVASIREAARSFDALRAATAKGGE